VGALRFDLCRFQAVPWPTLVDDVRYLEQTGAGTVWVSDVYVFPSWPDAPVLESWTTLAALAGETERVRLGTLVTDVALRHPGMLAKQVATVDQVSGGRVDLALGAGYYASELELLGISVLTPRGRADRLREAVEIVDGLLRERRLTYEGDHYRLADAPLVPEPVQQPRPPLLVAANGKRGLRLAAERADASVTLGAEGATSDEALARVRERNELLDDYCAQLGRDPASLDRAYLFGWAKEMPFASADALRDYLGRYGEAGVRRFIFWFGNEPARGAVATRETLEAFAAETLTG
jgi:alkanesulfonate monooxygenase SsuD/methylene tetrahydromethanopterin reductase-like flavin-dependent oxidoreductase (luciferase family)